MKQDDRVPLIHVRAGWIEDARTALCLVGAAAILGALTVPFVDESTSEWLEPASWLVMGFDVVAFFTLFVALGFGLIGTLPARKKAVAPARRTH